MSALPGSLARRLAAVLVVAAVAGVLVLPYLHPEPPPVPLTDCDLHDGPCRVALGDHRTVEISISPRPIPVLKPLTIEVRTEGFVAPEGATVDFSGVSMNMGINRSDLRRVAGDRLAGNGSLPVCVTGTMEWQAELRIDTGEAHPRRIALRFHAPRRP